MEEAFYDTVYAVQREHWWYAARRAILRALLADLWPGLPAGTLYDLGCGPGSNLPVLAEFGPALGIDASERAVALCRAQGLAAQRADLSTLGGLPPSTGAVVLLADVLEHLDDEAPCLGAAHRLLRPGGVLLVTVPACPFLWGPLDVRAHHRRRYTAGTLRPVIGALFTIEKLSYFNTALFGLVAAGRLTQRVFGLRGSDHEASVPPRPLNALLRATFSAERHLLRRGRLPFGVSLLCVARKSK